MPLLQFSVLALAVLNAPLLAQEPHIALDGSKIRRFQETSLHQKVVQRVGTRPAQVRSFDECGGLVEFRTHAFVSNVTALAMSASHPGPNDCMFGMGFYLAEEHESSVFDRFQRIRFTCEYQTTSPEPVTWSVVTLGDARTNFVLSIDAADAQSSFEKPHVDGTPSRYETRTWVNRAPNCWHAIDAAIETGSESMRAHFTLSSGAGTNTLFLRNVRIETAEL